MKDRASTSEQVGIAATAALEVINNQLGEERKLALEYEIIRKRIHQVASSEEEAVVLATYFYPHIPEKEIRAIYQEEASN